MILLASHYLNMISGMEKQDNHEKVALIVGITGMAGVCIAESLKAPTALGGPWKVYGVARRPKPIWFPSSIVDRYITLDAQDLEDTDDNLHPVAHEVTHVFWVTCHVCETEEETIDLNFTMVLNILNVFRLCPSSRLQHIAFQSATKHYMGPFLEESKAPYLVPHKTPFREDMPRLLYPNFYYFLEDLLDSYSSKLTWSVHRSSMIIGASTRSRFNGLLWLAVYASICRYERSPFRFPGSQYAWDHFFDFSDARVVAEQQIWATMTDKAKNQAFNCTNGDVFTWRTLWKELCFLFDVEFIDKVESFDWAGQMKQKGRVWDAIVEDHCLCKTKLEDMPNPKGLVMILKLNFQHVASMNKSREFGFLGYADTLKSFRIWITKLREMKLIP